MSGVKQGSKSISLQGAMLMVGENPAGARKPLAAAGIKRVSATFTRPSNTTAYTAGDVVGPVTTPAVLTFAAIARENGGCGKIKNARLSLTGSVATNGAFRLYLFDTAPTAIADNSPYTALIADQPNLIGHLDFTVVTEGSGSTALSAQATTEVPFVCTSGVDDIYGVLVAEGAFTPGSADVVRVNLTVEQL